MKSIKRLLLSLGRLCLALALVALLISAGLVKVYRGIDDKLVDRVAPITLYSVVVIAVSLAFLFGRGARWEAELKGADPQKSVGGL